MVGALLIILGFIELFMFVVSVWFIVFGIRTWNQSRKISTIVFVFGFMGLYQVASMLNILGFI